MPLDNSLGGSGAAPGSYAVLKQRPDTLVQVDGTLVPARTITAQVKTYGVVFHITVSDYDIGIAAIEAAAGTVAGGPDLSAAQALISGYAALIEALAILDPVQDIQYLEQVNNQGNFADYLVVTVGTPDGLQTAAVTVPLDPTKETQANNTVLAAYANLQAVAALT